MMVGRVLFWTSLAALAYVYVGYPFLIRLLARWFAHPVRKGPFTASVDVLIAAHNEERVIEKKLRNLLSLEGAEHIRQILVGSDGSSDQTVECARSVDDPRIRVFEFHERRGKSAVLNDLMRECVSDIVLMTDARQEIAKGALKALLENFADSRVGVVSGELVFRDPTNGGVAEEINAYWNYEKRIRRAEAIFHSVPGATGALYAIRRNLLKPIPTDTLLDDVVIPMQAVVRGYRCVFEPNAIVWDRPSMNADQEAIRKRRTLAGNVQLLMRYPEWLIPWRNSIAWQFLSHKVGRLLSPFLLGTCFFGAILAANDLVYLIAAVLQILLPLVSYFVLRNEKTGQWILPLRLVGRFYAMNGLIARAFADAIRGRFQSAWEKA